VLLVERGTELTRLSCRVCHSQIQPGERVLVAYRRGKPSVMHAYLCQTTSPYNLAYEAAGPHPIR
jgi:hypothetical protein